VIFRAQASFRSCGELARGELGAALAAPARRNFVRRSVASAAASR
jgi:hypothetical protein